MELEKLTGKHILSGIELGQKEVRDSWGYTIGNFVKFTLDGVTYIALENPDDGYRSYMEELEIVDEVCKTKLPDIEVVCSMRHDHTAHLGQDDDILSFVDANNGKEILAIGTANTNDYYPYCVFEYTPENMSCNEKGCDS